MTINSQLFKLYQADKHDRQLYEAAQLNDIQLKNNDKARLKIVKSLLAENQIDLDEIWNCHYLCLLFMHSWSDHSHDYEQAHNFAKKAVLLGSEVTKWLYAASLDRLLVSQGKLQKYGTQYYLKSGKIAPYDKATTDIERQAYGVPPLSQLINHPSTPPSIQ